MLVDLFKIKLVLTQLTNVRYGFKHTYKCSGGATTLSGRANNFGPIRGKNLDAATNWGPCQAARVLIHRQGGPSLYALPVRLLRHPNMVYWLQQCFHHIVKPKRQNSKSEMRGLVSTLS